MNNGLLVYFWAETIDTINYLYNHLPTKRDDPTIISKEAWTDVKQNLEHVHICGSRVSTFIPTQKRSKSDK